MCKIRMKALREFHTRVLAVFSSLPSRVYPSTDRLPVFLCCVPEFIRRILRKTFVSTFVLNAFAKSSSHGSLMRLQVYPFFPLNWMESSCRMSLS